MSTTDTPAPALDPYVFQAVVAGATHGVAVLDEQRRCRWVNAAGAEILATPPAKLIGRRLPLVQGRTQWSEWPVSAGGEELVAVLFDGRERDDQHRRKLAAFARTAARVALVGSVEDMLDRVAEEARAATGARACSIILRDGEGFDANLVGIAGHDKPYMSRLLLALHQGAPLATLEAFKTGRPARRSRLQSLTRADSGYGALVDTASAAGWTDLIAIPMIVKDETLGVLTCFYGEEQTPSDEDVAFLLAMADQCGVAVHISRMFAEVQAVAAAEQRHRWAHDLHDSVSQSLFSLVLQTRALRLATQRAGPPDGGQLDRGLVRLESLAQGMQAEMRALMTELRSGVEGEPLSSAVAGLAAEIRDQTGLQVELDLPATDPDVTDFVRGEAFRVIREAVHNSVRHADAGKLWIGVRTDDESKLIIDVVDDGRGFDATRPNPGHLGLWSMRERAERLGGSCVIVSSSAGTRVGLVVPLRRGSAGTLP